MPDVRKMMQQKMDEVQKKHPELSLHWLDSTPDVLRERTEVDGWGIYKEGNAAAAGTVGEIRVGDLVLGARSRKESEEDRKNLSEKTRSQVHAPVNQYYSDLERIGGSGGKYVRPLTPDQLARDGKWRGDR